MSKPDPSSAKRKKISSISTFLQLILLRFLQPERKKYFEWCSLKEIASLSELRPKTCWNVNILIRCYSTLNNWPRAKSAHKLQIQGAPGRLINAQTSVSCLTTTHCIHYLIFICCGAKVVVLLHYKSKIRKEKKEKCLAAYGAAVQACNLQHLHQTAEYGRREILPALRRKQKH